MSKAAGQTVTGVGVICWRVATHQELGVGAVLRQLAWGAQEPADGETLQVTVPLCSLFRRMILWACRFSRRESPRRPVNRVHLCYCWLWLRYRLLLGCIRHLAGICAAGVSRGMRRISRSTRCGDVPGRCSRVSDVFARRRAAGNRASKSADVQGCTNELLLDEFKMAGQLARIRAPCDSLRHIRLFAAAPRPASRESLPGSLNNENPYRETSMQLLRGHTRGKTAACDHKAGTHLSSFSRCRLASLGEQTGFRHGPGSSRRITASTVQNPCQCGKNVCSRCVDARKAPASNSKSASSVPKGAIIL